MRKQTLFYSKDEIHAQAKRVIAKQFRIKEEDVTIVDFQLVPMLEGLRPNHRYYIRFRVTEGERPRTYYCSSRSLFKKKKEEKNG
jgi:hypothetical protein